MDRRNIPPHNKSCLHQAHSQHQLKWGEMQSNSFKIGTRQRCTLDQYIFNVVLGV